MNNFDNIIISTLISILIRILNAWRWTCFFFFSDKSYKNSSMQLSQSIIFLRYFRYNAFSPSTFFYRVFIVKITCSLNHFMLILCWLFDVSKVPAISSIGSINWFFHLQAFQCASNSYYFRKQVLPPDAPIYPCTPSSFVDSPALKSMERNGNELVNLINQLIFQIE